MQPINNAIEDQETFAVLYAGVYFLVSIWYLTVNMDASVKDTSVPENRCEPRFFQTTQKTEAGGTHIDNQRFHHRDGNGNLDLLLRS